MHFISVMAIFVGERVMCPWEMIKSPMFMYHCIHKLANFVKSMTNIGGRGEKDVQVKEFQLFVSNYPSK